MQLRNLKRYFLAKNALQTFNRKSCYKFTITQTNILLAIYFTTLTASGVSKTALHRFLVATCNHTAFSEVTRGIDYLVRVGMIVRTEGGNVKRFHLSATGKRTYAARANAKKSTLRQKSILIG